MNLHCIKISKSGKYVRDGPDIEILADKSDTYLGLLERATTKLGMERKKGQSLVLFTSGGGGGGGGGNDHGNR